MAVLFPEAANSAIRVALVLLVATMAAIPIGLMLYVRTPYVTDQGYPIDQPAEFDHRHHVQDDGIDCRYCHSLAERSPFAGIPSTERCMGCHSQIWNDSPMLEPVRRSYFSGLPIPWNRVHDLPDFVFFDHSIHVGKGVGCVECHGRVDRMARVEQTAPLTMSWCLDCHRAPEARLRPLSKIASMDWEPDGDRIALGRQIARTLHVRRLTHCSTCHR